MLRLTLSEQDIKELDYQRYHHPHPRVQRKMEALLLKAKGLPHQQIASCVGVCEDTVRSYFQQYQTGGIEALKHLEFRRPTSELEAHHDTIEADFREHPVTTIPPSRQAHRGIDGPQAQSHPSRHLSQKVGPQALENLCDPGQVPW